ncbi:hypothetical protein M3M35_05520 [Fructilactobacillus myrtifloralis]|uniref:Glycerophosphoryl diester phosphodiesterase membrane domain-containing protein n=1 Tax=Fructilactobacillus myrtifloralis TaxID=2940301 RepID=A0ABY5BM53_9LACO|nr:hypothetical protein [Fructilactobacillus myrtifloralis]USS84765.1 hypothetical protein M3M35_05520 [Fructilactobacillus myrtifloralis]
MISDVLSKAYTTVKHNFWTLLAMVLPALLVSFIGGGLSSAVSSFNSVTNVDTMNGLLTATPVDFGGSFLVTLIVEVISFLLMLSFELGLIVSLQSGHFKFKNAFVVFHGLTWLVMLGIYVVFAAIMTLLSLFFLMVVIGFAIAANQSVFFGVLAFVVAVIGVVVIAYVMLGLRYVFFTYFVAKEQDDMSFFAAFVTNWKMMKGHRWQLLGLILMQVLIALVIALVVGIIAALIFVILGVIGNPGLRLVVAAILVIIAVVLFIAVYLFYGLWCSMAHVQFFLKLRDQDAVTDAAE